MGDEIGALPPSLRESEEAASASPLFQRAALLDGLGMFPKSNSHRRRVGRVPYLMTLQGVLAGESLSTWVAEEGFVTGVGVPVSFQIVLAIEGQGAHIASKRAGRGGRILHRTVDRGLWRVLRLGVAVGHRDGLGSVRFRGCVIIVVVQRRVCDDGGHRLPGGV